MLTQLTIQNFAIVKSLEIDWKAGMTTITGETGAGKSIAIDALGLCLGDRAGTNVVRPNCNKAELVATFELTNNLPAMAWLSNRDLDDSDSCILRRVISAEGRSKSYINGTPVPLAQLKELGQLLINIHGQHDHQLITKANRQREMLDEFGHHEDLLGAVRFQFSQWKSLKKERDQLFEQQQQREAQQQLLAYQVNELDEFALAEGEFEQLETDYKKFSNSQFLLDAALQSTHLLTENEEFNIADSLRKAIEQVASVAELDQQLSPLNDQLNEALVHIEDASDELRQYQERLELDPQSFQLIDDRYSNAIQLAKKHQVKPEELATFHSNLAKELSLLKTEEDRLSQIDSEIDKTFEQYKQAAQELTKARESSACKLSKEITQSLKALNMEHGQFSIDVVTDLDKNATSAGADDIQFLVSLNPGQEPGLLNKIASGGELSRISLAMQVILSAKVTTPSLIFDEVDVGISGPTAAMVGTKLQQLAGNTQVICVTHLPQVASKGHQQLFVAKLTDGEHTETTVTELSQPARVKEIARLLAGDTITDSSLANAEELLAS